MEGRILYYNPHTGEGKLILKSQEKVEFSADLWDDFDVVPAAGKLVSCQMEKGVVKKVSAVSFEEELDSVELKNSYNSPSDSVDKNQEGIESSSNGQQPTFSIEETISNYFKPIAVFIGEPPEVVNTSAKLDYFQVQRFLMTAYNDLKSLDASMHNNSQIKKILDEIQQLRKAFYTIEARLDSPKLAFEMIFLRSQPEYLQFIRHKDHCLHRVSILSRMEESLFPDIQEKEEAFKKLPKNAYKERSELEKELKSLRGHYVDTIHENAQMYEELSSIDDLKSTYTRKYFDSFLTEFMKVGGKYLETLKSILNYRAYDFDKLIWNHAEESRSIKEFLTSSNIEGEYSTLTFLRYYLKSLNKDKLNQEQRELLKLEEYLTELELINKNK